MDFFYEIWQTLTRNRTRSFLTAFGVFWGMQMLIILMGGGNAIQSFFERQTGGLSANSGDIWSQQTSLPYAGFQSGRTWEINYSDIDVIRQRVPNVAAISPVVWAGSKTVSHGTFHKDYNVQGFSPDMRRVMRVTVIQGRDMNSIDLAEQRKVCVIGARVRETIFPDMANPVGEYIVCGSMYLKVIGVLKEVAGDGWQSQANEQVQVPLTTLQKSLHMGQTVHELAILSRDNVPIGQTIEEVAAVLKQIHSISPDDQKAVGNWDMTFIFNMINGMTTGIFALVWLIGLGTLISGAVGVSNIMLVTVRERTREIGVRRALGASPFIIARQIIAESITLTLIAGLAGIVAGVGILAGAEAILQHMQQDFNIQLSFSTAVLCLITILLVGALAGLMPALRALNIKPIEALNEE